MIYIFNKDGARVGIAPNIHKAAEITKVSVSTISKITTGKLLSSKGVTFLRRKKPLTEEEEMKVGAEIKKFFEYRTKSLQELTGVCFTTDPVQ